METLYTQNTQIDLVAALVNVALDRRDYVNHAPYCEPVSIQARQMIDYAVDVLKLRQIVGSADHAEACDVFLRCAGHKNVQV